MKKDSKFQDFLSGCLLDFLSYSEHFVQAVLDFQECGFQSERTLGKIFFKNRVAEAARSSYNKALQLAFSGGYFGAAINIALAIFGVSFLFIIFCSYLERSEISVITHL